VARVPLTSAAYLPHLEQAAADVVAVLETGALDAPVPGCAPRRRRARRGVVQCSGGSQPSSTGGFQSVPTVFEPGTQDPSSGWANFVCFSLSWMP